MKILGRGKKFWFRQKFRFGQNFWVGVKTLGTGENFVLGFLGLGENFWSGRKFLVWVNILGRAENFGLVKILGWGKIFGFG